MGYGIATIQRHKTAIRRGDFSRPVKCLLRDGLLGKDVTFFDYGCGRGEDLELLAAEGIACGGWDPAYRPDAPRQEADVVNLGYVINVIEDPEERAATLRRGWELCRQLLVGVRPGAGGGPGQGAGRVRRRGADRPGHLPEVLRAGRTEGVPRSAAARPRPSRPGSAPSTCSRTRRGGSSSSPTASAGGRSCPAGGIAELRLEETRQAARAVDGGHRRARPAAGPGRVPGRAGDRRAVRLAEAGLRRRPADHRARRSGRPSPGGGARTCSSTSPWPGSASGRPLAAAADAPAGHEGVLRHLHQGLRRGRRAAVQGRRRGRHRRGLQAVHGRQAAAGRPLRPPQRPRLAGAAAAHLRGLRPGLPRRGRGGEPHQDSPPRRASSRTWSTPTSTTTRTRRCCAA